MKMIRALIGLIIQLFNARIHPMHILSGKRIAVVGPASSLFDAENGAYIDQFDFVFRVNKALYVWKKENEAYSGQKTTHLFHNMYENLESGGGPLNTALYARHRLQFLINPKNNFEGRRLSFNFYKKYLKAFPVYTLPKKQSSSCLQLFPKPLRPTMGFFALHTALTSQAAEVFITGFTFFKTPYAFGYRDALVDMRANEAHIKAQGIHDPALEFSLFTTLVKDYEAKKVITLDAQLNAILKVHHEQEEQ